MEHPALAAPIAGGSADRGDVDVAVFAIPAAFVAAQIDTLFDDVTIHAAKLGMLADDSHYARYQGRSFSAVAADATDAELATQLQTTVHRERVTEALSAQFTVSEMAEEDDWFAFVLSRMS